MEQKDIVRLSRVKHERHVLSQLMKKVKPL